ncbi:hypothetical protein [Paenibacillus sp. JMULE4]|uniref:hypothetical protein n=1 Tax=Paenibacillus sp. JMULE4 TaxID=2518342 RepID=UPI0035C83B6E
MSQIETIKNMQSKGLGPSAIAERLQMDRKTVRKVMKSETLENRKPKAAVAQPSKLDPYKPLIQSWLEEDRKNRYKQRHTAQRPLWFRGHVLQSVRWPRERQCREQGRLLSAQLFRAAAHRDGHAGL